MKKQIQWLVMAISVSLLGLVAMGTSPVQASKVGHVTEVKRTAYHANKGNIYTSKKLTKVRAKAKSYQHVTLYVTKHVKLKQNGKHKIFYYINTKQVKGWLWRGYLKAGKATPTVTAMNADAAKRFVKQTNKYRAAKGMQPISLDPNRMALLKTYKKWFDASEPSGDVNYDVFRVESGKVGLPTDELFVNYSPITSKADLKNSQRLSQYAIGTFMLVGEMQPDYADADILQPEVTKIGISWFEVKGSVYTMLLTNRFY